MCVSNSVVDQSELPDTTQENGESFKSVAKCLVEMKLQTCMGMPILNYISNAGSSYINLHTTLILAIQKDNDDRSLFSNLLTLSLHDHEPCAQHNKSHHRQYILRTHTENILRRIYGVIHKLQQRTMLYLLWHIYY